VDDVAGGRLDVVDERQRHLTQLLVHRGQEPELPQPPTDLVAPVGPAGQGLPGHQLGQQPGHRGDRQARPPGDLAQPQPGMAVVERGEDGQHA
jgi:hypothetical protein